MDHVVTSPPVVLKKKYYRQHITECSVYGGGGVNGKQVGQGKRFTVSALGDRHMCDVLCAILPLVFFFRFRNFPNKVKKKPVSTGYQALHQVVFQKERKTKVSGCGVGSNSLRRRLLRGQLRHWSSAGPVQWKHLLWQGLHLCVSSSQYSMAAHSLGATQVPWLFFCMPSWQAVQLLGDEHVRQDSWQAAGVTGSRVRGNPSSQRLLALGSMCKGAGS